MPRRLSTPEKATAELGERVRKARANAGLSTQELAEKVGVTSQHVRRIEAGGVQATAIVIARIARALDIPVNHLLDHVRSIEEVANELWAQHGMAKRLAGSRQADFKAKRAILESMGLWAE
jgi:transcriptional regulator with XRE-family HTH domain